MLLKVYALDTFFYNPVDSFCSILLDYCEKMLPAHQRVHLSIVFNIFLATVVVPFQQVPRNEVTAQRIN